MKSTVIKRSVVVSRHKTSISLEDAFWRDLRDIARAKGSTISELIEEIEEGPPAWQSILGDTPFRT